MPSSQSPSPALVPMISREQELALHVGDERRARSAHMSGGEPGRGGKRLSIDAREPLHVEQHVDRDHDDQHRREEERHERDRRALRPADRLGRVARDVLRAGVVEEVERLLLRNLTRSRWLRFSHAWKRTTSRSASVTRGPSVLLRKVGVDPVRGRFRLVDDDGREREPARARRERRRRDRRTPPRSRAGSRPARARARAGSGAAAISPATRNRKTT